MLSFRVECVYPGGFRLDLAFETSRPVTALFGASGSGKTTALECIAGVRRPQSGRIAIDGETVFDSAAGIDVPARRRRVGMVFQDHLLFPHLSVSGNLRFGARRAGGGSKEFDRIVELLGLAPLLDRSPRELSGGERQRVALGRALLGAPRLLLMDEPLAALDDALKLRILADLERAVREGGPPALFVSHAQAEVRRLAQWVVVIEAGRIVAEGPPEEALAGPATLGWKDEIGPANVLRIDAVEAGEGSDRARIGEQTLQIPPRRAGEPPPRWVQFSPGAVLLSRADVEGLSARNHLRGVVRRIVDLPESTFVAVDVGQTIWAEVTPQAVRDLQLEPGAEVTCLIKTHSLKGAS